MTGFQSGIAPHAAVIEYLVSQGAPVDLPDIGGLTALHHVAMNNVVGGVIKALLLGGADSNTRDRYGQTPIHGAIMNNQIEAINFCLAFGGDLDIADGDGIAPRSMLRYASPGLHAIVQKHLRKREGKEAPMENKGTCAACGKEGSKSQCSRCRVVRYCSSQCQSKPQTPYSPSFRLPVDYLLLTCASFTLENDS